MIELREHLRVQRSLGEVFDYLADFRSTLEWDSTVQAARKLTPGPARPGSCFSLECALPVGHLDLHYEIKELDRPRRLVLQGRGRMLEVRDEISLREADGGTEVEYRAQFTLAAPLRPFAARLRPGLERMGRATAEGLRLALQDQFPPPPAEPGDSPLAARLLGFTRRGYQRVRQHWHPMSASLRGRHAVVTGATSGLGAVTAMELARRGAAVTLVARDAFRGDMACAEILAETGNTDLRLEVADLQELDQVDALAERLRAAAEPVDILVNNAGALFPSYAQNSAGYERSLALLLLAPYKLTMGLRQLFPRPGARVINVVSGGMYTQGLSLRQLVDSHPTDFSGPAAYAMAKRALMCVTVNWAQQWRKSGIAVNAMHPGWVDTPGLSAALPGFRALVRPLLRSPEQGADTIIWLAAAREAAALSGKLFMDRSVQPLHLKPSTREDPAELAALLDWLRQFDPATSPSEIRHEESIAT